MTLSVDSIDVVDFVPAVPNIELLTKYNWKPFYDLYKYIEENRSVN